MTDRLLRRALVALPLLLAACGDTVQRDDSLSELGEQEDAQAVIEDVFQGILTEGESTCVGDRIFESEEIEVGQIVDFAEQPDPGGPVFEHYATVIRGCVDPNAAIPVVAPEGEIREAFIVGLRVGVPDITDAEANCIIDALVGAGMGSRQLMLSGYLPESAAAIQQPMTDAAQFCLAAG